MNPNLGPHPVGSSSDSVHSSGRSAPGPKPRLKPSAPPSSPPRYGQLSGLVEPIGGVLGAAFVHYCRPMLPYTMSLAAGAMIFVVCDSLVPEMSAHGNKGLAMQGLMLGFVVMMILDVTLG